MCKCYFLKKKKYLIKMCYIYLFTFFPWAKIKEAKVCEKQFKNPFWHKTSQAVALSVSYAELKLSCSWHHREHTKMLIK